MPAACRAWGRPLRVFLVDDNVDAVVALQMLLELEGHVVGVAHDGLAALAAADGFAADAFIIDIGLPGMDGCELVAALRRNPASARALMIAISGWGGPHDIQRALAAGFDRHLRKPAAFAAVLDALRQPHAR